MTTRVVTIARYTLLEALRTRLPLLTAAIIAILIAASFFIREIAITDSVRFQTAFYAAAARFAAVFVTALYVIATITREFNDKGLDISLALDLPRSHYILGKLAGFLAMSLVLASFVALPLTVFAGVEAALQWGASLVLELAVIVGLALFCVITFNQVMPAASFVLAFYLLARALTAIRLMSTNPISGGDAPSHEIMRWLIEALATVIPALDQWTQTAWLVDGAAGWRVLPSIGAQCALFVTVVVAAAIFDLHRRNF